MKKLWILLVVLAVMGAAPLFADVTLSGEFMGFASWDFSNAGSYGFPKLELNGSATVGDFNTVQFEFDSEGNDLSGYNSSEAADFVDSEGKAITIAAGNVAVDDFRLITDWGAALKLPIGVKTTVGYFDTYFTGWYYYDSSGWSFYYPWDNLLVEQGPKKYGAAQVDISAGPVNVHWYNDGEGRNFMVGADASFAGASLWLAYADTFQTIGDGRLAVEAAYNIMDMANVAAFFRYGLADSTYTYGANLGGGFGMFHGAAGLEGDDVDAVDNVVIEVTAAPMDAAKIALAAYLSVGGPDTFAGLNVEADYTVGGGATFALGYMYSPDATVAAGDNPPAFFKSDQFAPVGLYAAFYVAY